MINFANCQGPINCPNFMSLITNNRMGGLRMLGSSDASADLELRNEGDISISANEGRSQWQEDVAARARFIRLAFFEEDANSRVFEIPHLHDWVLAHRAELLSAIHAHVREWWAAGAPMGTTPFNSFPHWAEKVGGLFQFRGFGDPCLPEGMAVSGDPECEALKAVFELMFEKHPHKQVSRKTISDEVIKEIPHNYHLAWFGDPATSKFGWTLGNALTAWMNRTLLGITLKKASHNKLVRKHKLLFTKEGNPPDNTEPSDDHSIIRPTFDPPSDQEAHFQENPSQVAHFQENEAKGRPTSTDLLSGIGKKELINSDVLGENGQIAHKIINLVFPGMGLEVGTGRTSFSENVPLEASQFQKCASDEELKIVCETLSQSFCPISLDIKTYGQNPLDCFNADVRLIQIKVPEGPACLIDLFHVKELAPLKELLETHTVLGHNLGFEYKFLKKRLGIQLKAVWDTHSAFRVLDNNDAQPHYAKLGVLIEEELDIKLPKDQGASDWGSPSLTPEQLQYAADDVNFLHALKDKLTLKLEEARLMDAFHLEMLVLPVAAQLYLNGNAADRTTVEAMLADFIPQVESSRQAVRKIFGKPDSFNPNSNAQLLKAFQDDGTDITDTKEETLCITTHPAAALILKARGLQKNVEEAKRLLGTIQSDTNTLRI
jgi:ribonuclease D